MKKKTILYKIISVPIYKQDVVIFYGATKSDLIAFCRSQSTHKMQGELNAKEIEGWKESVSVEATTLKLPFGIIVTITNNTPSVVAHEFVHVATMISDRIGLPVDSDNQEFTAYMVGYLIEELDKVESHKFEKVK
jgi:hypothetical protein